MSFDLGGPSLALTPQVEAAVDKDRSGRHSNYGAVAGSAPTWPISYQPPPNSRCINHNSSDVQLYAGFVRRF